MTDSDSPFADSYATYRAAGWQPFDLPYERKKPPRSGASGRNGRALELAELEEIASKSDPRNIGLWMRSDVIGIDVDNDYDEKTGLATVRALEDKLGTLPDTFVSSARDVLTGSGIRFYRVEPNREYGDAGRDVETVWWGHRYAVVWPSKHPEGARYRWYDPDGKRAESVPDVDSLPMLPEPWQVFLQKAHSTSAGECDPITFDSDKHTDRFVNQALARLEEHDGEYHKLIFFASKALAAQQIARATRDGATVDSENLREQIASAVDARTPWESLDARDYKWIRDGMRKAEGSVIDEETLEELLERTRTERVPKLSGHPKWEHGQASLVLARELAGRFLHVEQIGWLKWDGTRWHDENERDKSVNDAVRETIRQRSSETLRALETIDNSDTLAHARSERDTLASGRGGKGKSTPKSKRETDLEDVIDEIDAHRKKWANVLDWWKALDHADNRRKVLNDVKSHPDIRASVESLDSQPHLLNCANGTVDLTTGELRKHDPRDLLTKSTNIAYRAGATHELWERAMSAWHPEIRDWLTLRIGAGMFGEPDREENILFNFGEGSAGKSTLTDALVNSLGEYATYIHDKAILGNPNDHGTERMCLMGARWAVLEELPEGQILRPSTYKKLVGTESFRARKIGHDGMEIPATHSLMVNSNHKPQVPEMDSGTWRRLLSIPWPYEFRDSEDECVSKTDRVKDPEVKYALKNDDAVKRAALATFVKGAVRYVANGKTCGKRPNAIEQSTANWKQANDHLGDFLRDNCEPSTCHMIKRTKLLEAFNEYLKALGKMTVTEQYIANRINKVSGYEHVENSSKKASDSMEVSSRLPEGKSEKGKTVRAYVGLKFTRDAA